MPLALAAVAAAPAGAQHGGAHDRRRPSPVHRAASGWRAVLVAAAWLMAIAAVGWSPTGGFVWDVGGLPVRMTNVRRTLTSRSSRGRARSPCRRRLRARLAAGAGSAPFLLAGHRLRGGDVARAADPRVGGRLIVGVGLYDLFFDAACRASTALRVPARFVMIVGAVPGGARRLRAGAGWRAGGARGAPAVARRSRRWLPRRSLGRSRCRSTRTPVDSTRGTGAAGRTVHRRTTGRSPTATSSAMPGSSRGDRVAVRRAAFGSALRLLRRTARQAARQRLLRLRSRRVPRSGRTPEGSPFDLPNAAWRAVTESGATHAVVHEAAISGDGAGRSATGSRSTGGRRTGGVRHRPTRARSR